MTGPERWRPTEAGPGLWTLEIVGGPAFARNAVIALEVAIPKTTAGPMRDALSRLKEACQEASP